jgi:hypothetical protein
MDGNGKPDFFGTPEYFMNRVYDCEAAGGGNMRVYCCSVRGKEVIPLFSVVMPIIEMIEAAAIVKQRASEIWNEGQMVVPMMELN